jgi:hypothetical protein
LNFEIFAKFAEGALCAENEVGTAATSPATVCPQTVDARTRT